MSLPYYNRYPGDYARDTRDLTLAEHGAYTLLLDYYYSNGCLKQSLEQCYRLCSAFTQDEQSAVKMVLDRFFDVNPDGGFIHERVEKEIVKQTKAYKAKVAKAQMGAAARWGASSNAPSNATGYANQNQNQTIIYNSKGERDLTKVPDKYLNNDEYWAKRRQLKLKKSNKETADGHQ